MDNTRIDEFGECFPRLLRRLEACEARFQATIDKQKPLPEPLGFMIQQGMTFAHETVEAIKEQLDKGRIPQAEILLRPLYEASVTMLWASREKLGWQRLQADAAKALLDWAEKGKNVPGFEDVARAVLDCPDRCAWASEAKSLPNVRQMLSMISDLDKREGLVGSGEESLHNLSYFMVYGKISQTTHGNILAMVRDPSENKKTYITISVVYSAYCMVRAVYDTFGWDVKPLEAEKMNILRG